MFSFGGKSKQNLAGVHPDLVRVANRAIKKSPVDFGISEGVRTKDRQLMLLSQRRTTTEFSQHIKQPHTGYGHAIDVFAYVNGKANWQAKYYGPIVQTFITEAAALGVQLRFGHLWKDFQDSPHIELHPKYAEVPKDD